MVKNILVNIGSSHSMSPDGTEPQPDQMLTSDLPVSQYTHGERMK